MAENLEVTKTLGDITDNYSAYDSKLILNNHDYNIVVKNCDFFISKKL